MNARNWARRAVQIAIAALAFVGVVWGSHIVWLLLPMKSATVVIVDKTVPFRNYREHAAFTWLLHAMKIVSPRGRYYEEGRDYVGYEPVRQAGRDLAAADLEHADCLFVSDTYGVYVGDYVRPGDIAALDRSPKIYGGVTEDEAAAVDAFVDRGGLTVAEFNAFASPTEPSPRSRLESVFGLRWTRWVARYWDDLGDSEEVPPWLGRDYERRYGRKLAPGPGLVFVREDEDIVVLRPGVDLRPDVLAIERTPEADPSWPERARYVYWLDVVERTTGSVLYQYAVATTEAGERALASHGLPVRFPAVLRGKKNAYYFAGDLIDTATEKGDPERAGLLAWKRLTAGAAGAEGSILWGFYYPILTNLLRPVLVRPR